MSMRISSTGELNLVSLPRAGGEGESFADNRLFQVRKVCEQFRDGWAGRKGLDNHANRHPHSANAGLAPITSGSIVMR